MYPRGDTMWNAVAAIEPPQSRSRTNRENQNPYSDRSGSCRNELKKQTWAAHLGYVASRPSGWLCPLSPSGVAEADTKRGVLR